MKALIIGGVAAGMSAASKLRRRSPDAEIVVLERGGEVSYGACGLPYYVAGYNDDLDAMRIRSAGDFRQMGIDVRLFHQAIKLDAANRLVLVRDLHEERVYKEGYDTLLIATGAEAIWPQLPGSTLGGVHVLKTLEDGERLRKSVEGAAEVAVVGGGFIGVEVAESLHHQGKKVRLIEAAPDVLNAFDPEIRDILRQRMKGAGIDVRVSERLTEILSEDGARASGIRTDKGEYPAQAVLLALGVRPATGFLEGAGLRMLANGALETDRRMMTNLPDIYAAGDCAAVYDRVAMKNAYSALGTVANKGGRIAGENMAGGHALFEGSLGSAAIAVCGFEAGRTGLGEAAAREMYGEVATSFIVTEDRPPYYPGGTQIWVKLICEKATRRLLGGQAVGEKGAVLRVDAIAAAITGGLTADELGMADFCYAPPFSEVWDALNIAGNTVK